jgi:hypothetical protein
MNTRRRFNMCAIVGTLTVVINGTSFFRIVTEMHREVRYLKDTDRETGLSACTQCEVQTLKCVTARGSAAAACRLISLDLGHGRRHVARGVRPPLQCNCPRSRTL